MPKDKETAKASVVAECGKVVLYLKKGDQIKPIKMTIETARRAAFLLLDTANEIENKSSKYI